jgi:hypothetical protein
VHGRGLAAGMLCPNNPSIKIADLIAALRSLLPRAASHCNHFHRQSDFFLFSVGGTKATSVFSLRSVITCLFYVQNIVVRKALLHFHYTLLFYFAVSADKSFTALISALNFWSIPIIWALAFTG